MNWNKSGFKELEKRIMLIAENKKLVLDVPFIRFHYDPELELYCISELIELSKRLGAKDCSCELIWANELLLDALRRIDTIENWAKFEKNDKQIVYKDLSDSNKGLTSIIAEILSDKLGRKHPSHCAIILRVGSLFPFVHISSLLTRLESSIKCMLVIPYPGKEGEILNYQGDSINNYYRGEMI